MKLNNNLTIVMLMTLIQLKYKNVLKILKIVHFLLKVMLRYKNIIWQVICKSFSLFYSFNYFDVSKERITMFFIVNIYYLNLNFGTRFSKQFL